MSTSNQLRQLQRIIALAVIVPVTFATVTSPLFAQTDTAPAVGLRENTPRIHALTNAKVIVSPGVVLESASIVLRDGLIESIGADIDIPPEARIWDLDGRVVYPGFIDPMSELGLPGGLRQLSPRGPGSGPPPQPLTAPANGYWNSRIRPEIDVAELLSIDAESIEAARETGFTAVLAVPRRGILRGQGAVMSLGDSDSPRQALIATNVTAHAGAETGGQQDEYPSSLMGVIALMRQAFYDAEWYADIRAFNDANPDTERAADNAALTAMLPLLAREQSLVYATDDELDYARALAIAEEFGIDVILAGNGHEYRKTDLLSTAVNPIIVPLDFPDAPDVAAPDSALDVSLETLQHWELAPSNAAFLADAGISFALTADGLDSNGDEFWTNLRLAVERGLPAETALAALTSVPAELLGLSEVMGTLESGKIANLVVADGELFDDEEAAIELVFIDGNAYPLDSFDATNPEGRWNVSWPDGSGEWSISRTGNRLRLTIDEANHRGQMAGDQVILLPDAGVFGDDAGITRMTGYISDDNITGLGERPGGQTFAWSAVRLAEAGESDASDADSDSDPASGDGAANGSATDDEGAADTDASSDIPPLVRPANPAGAFGLTAKPDQPENLLIRGATIWTSTDAGILDNADLLVRSGQIVAVGRDLEVPRDVLIIDGTGKHVTAGLVDAHSHTAISRGVNEVGSAITVEVRIQDVIDPTDISIYRQLAGGLTSANLMHGSANPMGGQVQTIKLRWGEDADGLLFDDAAPGVKFALGENVKQSNWGDQYTSRYPQTRMGVDEIIRDTFDAAAAYGAARENAGRGEPPVRRNLRLDAAREILNSERRVHIHSYRQDEILAFVRLAEDYSLDVAAFQHVLEGYKVGPEIASIGAGGSTFSDWWGFKFEVIDAMPFNGALMHEAGVIVSFNSDDDELATRLNTEAAKAVKYGNVPEAEALKFVTINPAIQLGVDNQVGSLEPGKDADFVIWSGHPLSTFTRAEQTWIEGRRYFDIAQDEALRAAAGVERARLIQKILREQAPDGSPPDRESDDQNEPAIESDDDPAGFGNRSDLYSSDSHRSHARGEHE